MGVCLHLYKTALNWYIIYIILYLILGLQFEHRYMWGLSLDIFLNKP